LKAVLASGVCARFSQEGRSEMPSATHAVEINKPIGEVFAYILDGTTAPSWRPGVLDIRLASGAAGQVGTRYEQGMKGPTGRIAADYELTEVVPNRLRGPPDRRVATSSRLPAARPG